MLTYSSVAVLYTIVQYSSDTSSLVISDSCIVLVDSVPTTVEGGFVLGRNTSCDGIITVLEIIESERKQDTVQCQLSQHKEHITAALSKNNLLRESL